MSKVNKQQTEQMSAKKENKVQITLKKDDFNLILMGLLSNEDTKSIGTMLYLNAKEIK